MEGITEVNSIITGDTKDKCYICGRWGQTEEHHMIHGTANRRNAEHYGLKVYLCPHCHHRVHCEPGGELDLELKKLAQTEFERKWGHKEWMKVFQKSYLG